MNPFPAPVGADDPGGPLVRLPLECVGAVINRPGKCRPPDGGQEGLAPARGLAQPGCTPHFLFHLVEKKTGRARSKRKGRLDALRCSGPPRATGVGVSVPAPILPSLRARLGLLRFPQLPTRGGWCGGRRGARSHLTSFSFRAFRVATRWLVLRGSVSGSGKRSRGIPEPPRA